jgi:hypothetical protein
MAAVVDLCMVTKAVGFPFTCGRTLPTAVFENAALMTYIVPSLPVGIFSTYENLFSSFQFLLPCLLPLIPTE